jgi:hypothetical protein
MSVILEAGLAIAIAIAPIASEAAAHAIPGSVADEAGAGITQPASDDGRSLRSIIPCGTHLMFTYYWQPLRGPLLICRFDAWDEHRRRSEHEQIPPAEMGAWPDQGPGAYSLQVRRSRAAPIRWSRQATGWTATPVALEAPVVTGGTPLPEANASIPAGFEVTVGDVVLEVRAPTVEEEYELVIWHLGQRDWYRENGYTIALPDHPAFGHPATPDQYRATDALEVFRSEVFRPADYAAVLANLEASADRLAAALEWFAEMADAEGFAWRDRYTVVPTLYGPGGSYDPWTGTVLLGSTRDGGGASVETIVHEMVHIVIEEGLVERHGLDHWQKERLVDRLVQREFQEVLPDAMVQPAGDPMIDELIEGVPLAGISDALRSLGRTQGRSRAWPVTLFAFLPEVTLKLGPGDTTDKLAADHPVPFVLGGEPLPREPGVFARAALLVDRGQPRCDRLERLPGTVEGFA